MKRSPKLLVVGAPSTTKRMLRKLAGHGALEIEWRGPDDELSRRMEGCAAVLIDGNAASADRASLLLERVARLRRRMPGVPVILLTRLGAASRADPEISARLREAPASLETAPAERGEMPTLASRTRDGARRSSPRP